MLSSRAELRQLPNDHWLIVLHGDHDVATSPSLSDALAAIPRPHEATMIVELGRAEFIDSTTLNTIVQSKAGGTPIVLCAHRGCFARRLLDVCEIGERVPIYETVGDALVGLHRSELIEAHTDARAAGPAGLPRLGEAGASH